VASTESAACERSTGLRYVRRLSGRPIFILGLMQRTGTVFLSDLLALHPDCAVPAPLWEDFLLAQSDPLIRYADALMAGWRTNLRLSPEEISDPLPALGGGLISMLTASLGEQRLVTKTPSVRNLESFFRLFPNAYLVILVRDGRAVVESAVRMWGGSYAPMMRRWVAGARKILECDRAWRGEQNGYLIVRYEDLVSDLQGGLRKVFDHCQLDPGTYDFEAAAALPVRGSSRLMGPTGRPHWRPVEKPPDFAAHEAWHTWPRSLRQEFQLIASEVSSELGYESESVPRLALRARARRALNDLRGVPHARRWAAK
jgi:hypothetical protein